MVRVIAMLLLAASVAPDYGAAGSDTAAPPARVRVTTAEAEDAEASLQEWLVVRLLEEGYAVAGDDGAEIDLSVWPAAQLGWTVRAEGETTEAFNVSIGEDEAVARLELLHRAVDALRLVVPRDRPADASSRAFAIELAPTFGAENEAAIEAEVALAVLEGGGSLAPDRSFAAFAVCAAPGNGGTHVDVVRSDQLCPMPDAETAALAPAGALTVQLVEAALLSAAADAAPPEITVEQAHDSERPPLHEPDPTFGESHRRVWGDSAFVVRGGASAGVIGRITTVDPVVAASMFIGREPGLSAWFDVQLWPAITPGPLQVFETLPAVGLRLRPFTDGRISLDLGTLVGIETHSYRYVTSTVNSRGLAGDFSIEGALGFAVKLWSEHELQLLFRAGRAGRERKHTLEGQVIWQREPWRVGGTIGLTFGRRVRR